MMFFSAQFIARYHEMDQDRKMRVQCLCNYLEEAAGYHADKLGLGLEKLAGEGLAWVLAKMKLQIDRRPAPGEPFWVNTWPVSIERLQFRRDFEVLDDAGKPIAKAVTQWVVMNLSKRRLERFPPYIASLQPNAPPLAIENADIRIPALDETAKAGPSFPVRLADIDQNQHVNNGRYVDFSLEAAHLAGMRGELKEIDLIFRAEGKRGDVICSRSEKASANSQTSLHSLYREDDGQELARARTVWG